jgi:hypothetical protein
MPGGDDGEEEVIVVQTLEDKVFDRFAGKLRELMKKQLLDAKALSAPAFFALAAFHCPSEFVAAFTAEQLALASRCDAWFAFGDAGLAMVPSVGTAEKTKAAHALECVSMFGEFVGELEPRWEGFDNLPDPFAGLSWKGGGDAGAGVSRAADLLDSAAEAAERAKGKRAAGVNASTINNPKTRAAAQEAMDDPFSGAAGTDRGTCPCSLFVVVPSRRVGSTRYFCRMDRPVLAALLWF